MKLTKGQRRQRIRHRIRKKVSGTPECPRLSVFRSNKDIYAQLIDDVNGLTLAAASSRDAAVTKEGTKIDHAKAVGLAIAAKAKDLNIDRAVFDRSGYLYHGRVKALADGTREGGVQL